MLKTLTLGLTIALFTLIPSISTAQTRVAGTEKFGWNQPAPATGAFTLADANAYRFDGTLDAAAPTQLQGVACTGATAPFACTSNFVPSTPGLHTFKITSSAVTTGGVLLTSGFSNSIQFVMLVIPVAPTNLNIVENFGMGNVLQLALVLPQDLHGFVEALSPRLVRF